MFLVVKVPALDWVPVTRPPLGRLLIVGARYPHTITGPTLSGGRQPAPNPFTIVPNDACGLKSSRDAFDVILRIGHFRPTPTS